ncbi:MAG TPA: methyltransferase domain-containing protein [Bryobacteraceae bacterium]|nr:methyltransferase domain-containing protein [Bryobacteraceae bacterium]
MKLGWIVLLASAAALGQVAKEANREYKEEAFRTKLAGDLTAESRDLRQKPKELIAALKVEPGMTVADVGTGAGYMLPHLAAAVGPSGKVYAEDIFPDFLDAAKKHAAKLTNVTYVLGDEKSARLPAGVADLIIVLDAYHHFDHPGPMLESMKTALKPGGRLAIVEFHKTEKAMPNGRALQHIRATRDEFVKEIAGFGFETIEVRDFTPEVQWIGVFRSR